LDQRTGCYTFQPLDHFVSIDRPVTWSDPPAAPDASNLDQTIDVSRFHRLRFFYAYGDFMRDVSAWVREGRIKYREDVVEGLENAPTAIIGLLRGENFGKLLVRVAH
jgi:hypothetical protein